MSAQFNEMMASAVAKTQPGNAEGGRRNAEDNPARAADAYCRNCGFKMVGGADVGLCPKCGGPRWFKAEGGMRKAEDKKATVRIELPSRAVLVIEMCASVQELFSTLHNSVLAGSVQLTATERVKLQIELEQLSRSALHVAKQIGGEK